MKIALIQDWLTSFAGGEQTLLALHEMYPEAPIYTSMYRPENLPQFANATVITSYLQRLPGPLRRQQIALPLMPAAFESINLKEYDTVISVGGGLSKGVITYPGQRHISYCHTPIRYIWNLGGDDRTQNGWLRQAAAHYLRLWDVDSASRVDRFIANSQTVADRIAKIYRMPATVVYPPIHTDRFQILQEPTRDYFLSVNRLVGYKRVDVIIEACKKAKVTLKVTGGGPDEGRLRKLAGHDPHIEFLGRVPDKALQGLYGNARAFIQASEEDFGIVPVEAMAAGRPVIAYDKGGVRESVVAGKTGVFFGEQTVESLTAVLTDFSDDWDSGAIRKRALEFDVEVFKEKMREVIEN
ncbi:glycosyltransferase [Patescibacteria group bacterium]|nr:glycosyltransferase [Patescibacteria group bacterium]